MDLNYVLMWLVGLSAATGLVAFSVRYRGRLKGWLAVFTSLLVVLGAGVVWFPDRAGLAAGVLSFGLFFLPMAGQRWLQHLTAHQQYATAVRLARLLAVLHPADGWREQPAFLEVLDELQRGDVEAARSRLAGLEVASPGRLARFARLQLFRVESRWQEARQWIETHVDRRELLADPQLLASYLRALGELGEPELLLQTFRAALTQPALRQAQVHLWLFVLSMTGRTNAVEALFDGPLRMFSARIRRFWQATAMQVAGRPDEARPILEELVVGDDSVQVRASRSRLQTPLPSFDIDTVPPDLRELVSQVEQRARAQATYGTLGAPRRGSSWVTRVLLAAMALVFAAQIPGGTTDTLNLYHLGALVVSNPPHPEAWWRVVTAMFLHYGVVHFLLNGVNLWFLGRYMERIWGGVRLGASFLVAGVGANTVAVWLLVSDNGGAFVVGASGGVMGVLGGLVALIAIEWRRTGVVLLKRQLWLLGLIVVLQTVFDLLTPRVSSTIHMSGLGIGLLLGVVMRPKGPVGGQSTDEPGRAVMVSAPK